jgi:hypothetical protein
MRAGRHLRHTGIWGFIKSQAVAIILFLIIAVTVWFGIADAADVRDKEEMKMAQDSVRRAVVSCYAIEGRYPESYEYLAENYGLTVDENKYTVHYEIFAPNIMPEITITQTGN